MNMQRLELFDETLEKLGLPRDYSKTFIQSLKEVVTWFVTICILVSSDINFLMRLFKNLVRCLYLIFLFHFPLHLNSVVDFNFISIVNTLGMRFENINSLLERTISENSTPEFIRKSCPNRNRWKELIMSTKIKPGINDKQNRLDSLILIRHLHMELSKISRNMNCIYQKQMTMEMGSLFVTITGLLYNLFAVIFIHNEALTEEIRFLISMSLWCAAFAFRFLRINTSCARVSSQSLKTKDILYEMKVSIEDHELKKEIEQFCLQLAQCPLIFTASGFSTLDYTFVRRFTGTVTTYLVILIQFSPEISD